MVRAVLQVVVKVKVVVVVVVVAARTEKGISAGR